MFLFGYMTYTIYICRIILKPIIMTHLFQVVLDGVATVFTFEKTQKVQLVDKMVELQEQFPKAKVTFLIVDL